MENDGRVLDELKGSLHYSLERAIETEDPQERRDALGAAIEEMRELNVRDAGELVRRILHLHGLI